jgi:YidC/Oxa1 family membrane protein insertase
MEQQRNLFIAIALSIAILVGFQFFIEKPRTQHEQARQAETAAQQQAQTPSTAPSGKTEPGTPPAPGTAAPAAASALTRAAALAQSPRIPIDTPSLHGSISLIGGRIDDLALAQYHETVDSKSPEIILLSPSGGPDPYLVDFGWSARDPAVKVPGPDTQWTAPAGAVLKPGAPVELTWDNGAGLKFTRTFSVDEKYMFTVKQAVDNTGTEPVSLAPYSYVRRTGTPHTLGYTILHEGPVGYLGGRLHEQSYSKLNPATPEIFPSTGGWLGITDKYWLVSVIPDQKEEVTARFAKTEANGVDTYQTDFLSPEASVPPGGHAESTSRSFDGPKEVRLLDTYRDTLGIANFDSAVDWGWLFFLTKPIFKALDFFYSLLGNFGLAILLLTVIVKALFFPLANKSYHAMSKMKKLQPKMNELREKYGEDKARLNQEMMALYKQHGANPLAGCLPIVIQIPVFFSLYKVLFVTIEMRHAPFYGWIHDLSATDPTTFWNLFGLIPWDPIGTVPALAHLSIGAWPLIMGCTMYLQQKLNPQPADPVQAKMFMFLPIIFTYMMSAFPAGLVIYWSWNNLLSVAQQWVIMRRDRAV